MYHSIVAPDMLAFRGSHHFERMDDIQLADLGIDRWGSAIQREGRIVHEIPKFDAFTFLAGVVTRLVPEHFRSVPPLRHTLTRHSAHLR
jgi:hypothetical protein